METKLKDRKLTFKPLTSKRFRCNQTGEITKNCEKYRRSHQPRRKRPKVWHTNMARDRRWRCPNCGHINYSGSTNVTNVCSHCSENVVIVL